MIAVILDCRHKRPDLIGHFALDPEFLKFLRVTVRQQIKCTHSIIHEPDFYTFVHFPFQDLQDCIPHNSFLYNEIFHENELLCFFQLFNHRSKFILSHREIFDFRIAVGRKSKLMWQIIRQLCICRFACPECLCNLLILIHIRFCLHTKCRKSVLYKSRLQLQMYIDIKYRSYNRKCHHTQHPGHFKCRVSFCINDIYKNNDFHHAHRTVYKGCILFQIIWNS